MALVGAIIAAVDCHVLAAL